MCYNIEQVREKIEKMINRGYITRSDLNGMPEGWVLKAFMHPSVMVVTNEQPHRAQMLTWGLIPSWTKPGNELEIRKHTLNAKSETLTEKPSFKHLVGKQHCLIPVSGFYEWKEIHKSKYPHYIYMKNKEPFMLAGIWDTWKEPFSKITHKTFSILTCEANDLMKEIHNKKMRMPVIISKNDEEKWLNAKTIEDVESLCLPFDDDLMDAHPIDKTIIMDKNGFNVPGVNKKIIYPDLNQGTLFD